MAAHLLGMCPVLAAMIAAVFLRRNDLTGAAFMSAFHGLLLHRTGAFVFFLPQLPLFKRIRGGHLIIGLVD